MTKKAFRKGIQTQKINPPLKCRRTRSIKVKLISFPLTSFLCRKYLDCNFHKGHGIDQNIWIVCGEAHLVLHGNWSISVAATNPQEDPQFQLKLSASSWLGAFSIQQTIAKILDPAKFGKHMYVTFVCIFLKYHYIISNIFYQSQTI